MSIYSALSEFGIDKSKAKVFIATLEIGSGSAQDVANHAQLPRTTTHEILQQLCSIGVVSYVLQGRTRIYTAENPNMLQSLLRRKQRKLDESLPDLMALYNPNGTKPRTRIFEGQDGMQSVFNDILTVKNRKLCAILSMEDLYKTVGKSFMDEHIQQRISLGIHLDVIRSQDKDIDQDWASSDKELRTVHFAPAEMIFPTSTYLYDNKVVVLSTKREGFALIIESTDYSQTQKNLFSVLWQTTRVMPKID
ncbi:transcriptional regulator TrmB [Candidatus Nomurabacteria bacterium]|nr:transcriptional regulator TrmB [Candidatus Nomurabacteria bacterium]